MADAWQTMEEAALTLGISSRTLHRRITKGEYETRLTNGRREVLVQVEEVPEQAMTASEATATEPETTESQAVSQVDAPSDTSVLALHEDRIRRTDLAIAAYQQSARVATNEARRWRVGARVAWSCAAASITALFITGLWATHRLTAASAAVTNLTGQVQQLSDKTEAQSRLVEQFRQEAESARVSAARAEGALSVQQQRVAAAARRLSDGIGVSALSVRSSSTTRPSLLDQIVIPPALAVPQPANITSVAINSQ